MHFEAFGQLYYRLFSLEGFYRYLCLECRSVWFLLGLLLIVLLLSVCFSGHPANLGFAICPVRGYQAIT